MAKCYSKLVRVPIYCSKLLLYFNMFFLFFLLVVPLFYSFFFFSFSSSLSPSLSLYLSLSLPLLPSLKFLTISIFSFFTVSPSPFQFCFFLPTTQSSWWVCSVLLHFNFFFLSSSNSSSHPYHLATRFWVWWLGSFSSLSLFLCRFGGCGGGVGWFWMWVLWIGGVVVAVVSFGCESLWIGGCNGGGGWFWLWRWVVVVWLVIIDVFVDSCWFVWLWSLRERQRIKRKRWRIKKNI